MSSRFAQYSSSHCVAKTYSLCPFHLISLSLVPSSTNGKYIYEDLVNDAILFSKVNSISANSPIFSSEVTPETILVSSRGRIPSEVSETLDIRLLQIRVLSRISKNRLAPY